MAWDDWISHEEDWYDYRDSSPPTCKRCGKRGLRWERVREGKRKRYVLMEGKKQHTPICKSHQATVDEFEDLDREVNSESVSARVDKAGTRPKHRRGVEKPTRVRKANSRATRA